jgi:hypothetical protein
MTILERPRIGPVHLLPHRVDRPIGSRPYPAAAVAHPQCPRPGSAAPRTRPTAAPAQRRTVAHCIGRQFMPMLRRMRCP